MTIVRDDFAVKENEAEGPFLINDRDGDNLLFRRSLIGNRVCVVAWTADEDNQVMTYIEVPEIERTIRALQKLREQILEEFPSAE